jgi:nicotinamide mononucleotide adenylyltransferase
MEPPLKRQCLDGRRASPYTAFSPFLSEADLVNPPLRSSKLNFKAPPGKKPVVLVSCGSFSPPTVFHLRMMEDARDGLTAQGYHVAGGFLSPVHTAYGKKSLVAMHHRVNMVGLALQDSQWLDVDLWECSQKGYTYTALALKNRFEAEVSKLCPEARVMMVCGGDLLESFTAFNADGTPVWAPKDQEIILKDCGVACMERDGTDLNKVISDDKLLTQHKSNIAIFKPTVVNNVSSTLVRKLLQAEKSIKYLVHEEVHEYIHVQNLASAPQWQ